MLPGVEFTASLGIRLLFSPALGQRLKGTRLVLCCAQPLLQQVFEQAGLEQAKGGVLGVWQVSRRARAVAGQQL